MTIKYNAPVILTYALDSLCVLVLKTGVVPPGWFASPAGLAWQDPWFYLRLVSYVLGHANWQHLMGNLMIILLVGPLLEEKYGAWKLFEMILVTAVVTALVNALAFSVSLVGGSGIAFMLVLLCFILVAAIFIGSEVADILKLDRISQFSHLAGGFIGAAYGFMRGGRR